MGMRLAFTFLMALSVLTLPWQTFGQEGEDLFGPFLESERQDFAEPKMLNQDPQTGSLFFRSKRFNVVVEGVAPIVRFVANGAPKFQVEIVGNPNEPEPPGQESSAKSLTIDSTKLSEGENTLGYVAGQQFELKIRSNQPIDPDALQIIGVELSYLPLVTPDGEVKSGGRSTIPDYKNLLTVSEYRERLDVLGQSIAKIRIGRGSCTGFLYKDKYLITNYHCVRDSDRYKETKSDVTSQPEGQCHAASDCSDVTYQFDFQFVGGANYEWKPSGQCVSVPIACKDLDFAVLEISDVPPFNSAPRKSLTLAEEAPVADETAFLLHHPLGLPLQVQAECGLSETIEQVQWSFVERMIYPLVHDKNIMLFHECDTEGGSSGSPVISMVSEKVVALHAWSAFPAPSNRYSRWNFPTTKAREVSAGIHPDKSWRSGAPTNGTIGLTPS